MLKFYKKKYSISFIIKSCSHFLNISMVSFLSFSLLMTVGKRNRNDFVKFLELTLSGKSVHVCVGVCVFVCVCVCVYVHPR